MDKPRAYYLVKRPNATGGKIKILVKQGASPWKQAASLNWINGFAGLTEAKQTAFAERIINNLIKHQYEQL
jgi:hypothetical protein